MYLSIHFYLFVWGWGLGLGSCFVSFRFFNAHVLLMRYNYVSGLKIIRFVYICFQFVKFCCATILSQKNRETFQRRTTIFRDRFYLCNRIDWIIVGDSEKCFSWTENESRAREWERGGQKNANKYSPESNWMCVLFLTR